MAEAQPNRPALPTPDAAASHAERRRLFETPRSSWDDYDRSLISEGGGVWSRSAKAIPVSEQAAAALGLDGATSMTPTELIHLILQAPVDLLWNGGIGTYVKAESESHADVGDKANDAVRVDGGRLRVTLGGRTTSFVVVHSGGTVWLAAGGRVAALREHGRYADALSQWMATPPGERDGILRALLAEVEGCLADGAHQGLRHGPPAWKTRLGSLGARARGLGLARLAGELDTLATRLTAARSTGGAGEEAALTQAWADAALRVWVAQEQLGA